jgi:hypothetical protein
MEKELIGRKGNNQECGFVSGAVPIKIGKNLKGYELRVPDNFSDVEKKYATEKGIDGERLLCDILLDEIDKLSEGENECYNKKAKEIADYIDKLIVDDLIKLGNTSNQSK